MVSDLILLAITIYLVILWFVQRRGLPPGIRPLPGPKGLPYVGPVHAVPVNASWIKFYEWSKKYGPIYQMQVFGTSHVWISSEQIAQDLLSKRSHNFSDRPLIPNLPNNRTSGDYLALLGSTETWKRQRKLCNHLMHISHLQSLHSYPSIERDRFLFMMWRDPTQYVEWIEQFTSRTVSRLCWGTPRPSQVLRHTTFGLLETISPSGALPNLVSFLRFVPRFVSPWKKKEGARYSLEDRLWHANVQFVLHGVALHGGWPSFIRTFLETKESPDEKVRKRWGEQIEAMHVVGLMAIAGALTIGSPIQSFLLAMCHYPEWQARLQEEIDGELNGRCPQWEDREKLPLLRAVVKEVIRWRPPVPTGIPHASLDDDVYDGFYIPGGATVHALEWAITREATKYPHPDDFDPGRWIDPTSPIYRPPLSHYPNLGGFSQFGFGRRTCQGVPIVEQDLFLAMGGMAWLFAIRKRRDPATGAEVPVHWNDFTPLLIAKPVAFPFDAVPRSPDKVRCVRDMHGEVWRCCGGGVRGDEMDIDAFRGDLGERIFFDDVAEATAVDAAELEDKEVRSHAEVGSEGGEREGEDEAVSGAHDVASEAVSSSSGLATPASEGPVNRDTRGCCTDDGRRWRWLYALGLPQARKMVLRRFRKWTGRHSL